jgi:hypothetical protein
MRLTQRNGPILAGRRPRLVLCMVAVLGLSAALTGTTSATASKSLLAGGLASGAGSTVGPDGALYVTVGATGQVVRIDPKTGAKSVFASGLPPAIVGLGGAFDIEFIDGTAYVLVTVVGSDVGGHSVVGIYRRDGPHDFTVIADIGAYAAAHPPATSYFIPSGVQYAMERYRGGFLVTDGHHNRVYRVTLDGHVSEVVAFNDIVPTGLAVRGNTVYMAEAGPNPHLPQTGRIVAFGTKDPEPVVVASGGRLLVDAEFSGGSLYGLSQGLFPVGSPDGSPAMHDTGSLLRANADGSFSTVITGLDQPTSVEFIGTSAYVVTLGGEVWKVANARGPHSGAD